MLRVSFSVIAVFVLSATTAGGAIVGFLHWGVAGFLLSLIFGALFLLQTGGHFKNAVTEIKENKVFSMSMVVVAFLVTYFMSVIGEDMRAGITEFKEYKKKCTENSGEVVIERHTSKAFCVKKLEVDE